MIQNYDIDISDFLKLTNSGLFVADFVQVKAAIIKRYKLAYGDDIDLSTATADGIFVNDLALIINNILKTISTMYANLDVNQASGIYLDMLCRLANVKRKLATNSTASITIKNNSDSQITIAANDVFIDKAGTEWTNIDDEQTIAAGESISITVKCNELGPVSAPAGYIDTMANAALDVTITQTNPAIVGLTDETDADLRERRAQSNGAHGVTVLESLIGALLEIDGIQDCKIYNNATANSITAKDGTSVAVHDIYVILRKNNINIDDKIIANLIYEKLTPGIRTTETSDTTNGYDKSAAYLQTVLGTSFDAIMQQDVYWKEAKPIAPTFGITIQPSQYFDINIDSIGTNDTLAKIATSAIDYFNALKIGIVPTAFDLQSSVVSADPTFKGRQTFLYSGNTSLPANADTYFDYTDATFSRYALLTSEPDNWNGHYSDYFKLSDGMMVANASSTWATNTYYKQLTDADTDTVAYYVITLS